MIFCLETRDRIARMGVLVVVVVVMEARFLMTRGYEKGCEPESVCECMIILNEWFFFFSFFFFSPSILLCSVPTLSVVSIPWAHNHIPISSSTQWAQLYTLHPRPYRCPRLALYIWSAFTFVFPKNKMKKKTIFLILSPQWRYSLFS